MISLQSIVDRQIQRWNLEMKLRRQGDPRGQVPRPVITISRTLGSGGGEVARLVARRMGLQLFEREILDQIAERSDVRRELVESLDEHARSRLESWVDGMLRRRIFDEGDYYHHLIQVLTPLAELGSVVIVGRGANFILHGRPSLDVRIVASFEARVRRIMEKSGMAEAEAEQLIQRSDADRRLFIRRLFDKDQDDPLGYHLILNTDRICLEAAVTVIETAWMQVLLKCQAKPAGA